MSLTFSDLNEPASGTAGVVMDVLTPVDCAVLVDFLSGTSWSV